MGKTKSEVVDWTQNFWIGCQSVSEGCVHCYARAMWQEFGHEDFDKVVRSKTWGDPIKWQRRQPQQGKLKRYSRAA